MSAAPPCFAWEGDTPWNRVKARLKLSGVSYPYFSAPSITRTPEAASSLPARDSRRIRI